MLAPNRPVGVKGARGIVEGVVHRLPVPARGVRSDASLVGLAFECQIVDEVPIGKRDVFMDLVITETGMYPGTGRLRKPAVAGEESTTGT